MSARTIIDPVCDMIVDIAEARDRGLTLDYPEREYAFCAPACQTRFAKDPKSYIPKVETWVAQLRDRPDGNAGEHAHEATGPAPDIDAGMRAWYKSCRCCLSDAHPQVVAVLDAERATSTAPVKDTGIRGSAESG
jgi:YHS domain-containing protein